jgi:hypothetical protein
LNSPLTEPQSLDSFHLGARVPLSSGSFADEETHMSEPTAPAAPPFPTDIPELFAVHSAESWAREVIAHAIRTAHSAPGGIGVGAEFPAEVIVTPLGDGLGVTLRIGKTLHCVTVGR